MSNKQDRQGARTPADLERRYNFGQTFAEVFDLISDAQTAAEEAQKAVESLDQEQIFNLLTDNGRLQGVYRGDDGEVYINASYIKAGKLAAQYIDADNLNVKAANITGTLTFNQLSPELQQQINNSDAEGYLRSIGITEITSGGVKSPRIEGGEIVGAGMYGGIFSNLDEVSFIRMRSESDYSDPNDTSMVHVLEHFVGNVNENVPVTQMGYLGGHVNMGNGVTVDLSTWTLFVMGNMLLVRDLTTGITKAYGKWDFSGATVTGL